MNLLEKAITESKEYTYLMIYGTLINIIGGLLAGFVEFRYGIAFIWFGIASIMAYGFYRMNQILNYPSEETPT